jgi:hypothetical protein
MLRYLQVQQDKPVSVMRVASEAMTTGMAVSIDYANGEVDKATGIGYYLVDVPRNYDGANSAFNYPDDEFEDIALGDRVIQIPVSIGDRFATNQITATGLSAGDPLDVAAGLFKEATSGDAYGWVYGGTYADPTGTLHIVERVPNATV